MFEMSIRNGVLRVRRKGARWLSTGWDGGEWRADAAYNVSVPEGFDRTDLDAYLAERREEAGFNKSGPALLTGVELDHARGARCGPVSAVATAGISNPAALPMASDGVSTDLDGVPTDLTAESANESPGSAVCGSGSKTETSDSDSEPTISKSGPEIGTVNVIVGTERSLAKGALANLLAVAVEAKTTTLLAETGFPGTTSDAAIAACDPAGEEVAFSGSATEVGACARACVREAVRTSVRSRYGEATDATIPESVADAEHGVTTDRHAEVFALGERK